MYSKKIHQAPFPPQLFHQHFKLRKKPEDVSLIKMCQNREMRSDKVYFDITSTLEAVCGASFRPDHALLSALAYPPFRGRLPSMASLTDLHALLGKQAFRIVKFQELKNVKLHISIFLKKCCRKQIGYLLLCREIVLTVKNVLYEC